ncbi:type 4 pilus major pilin [Vibrio sp. D431a]|uniref:type 4 pilus major pilin n=1 Tax=Vibrio sp. D431a TaxID=2837388 RepID=UPI002553287B|nr:type 4 pilus major pilin [Vibrio sp. D431a]MDK9793844.1 type II secretion system GspH family protein [Vibrio sp. D431a]
MNLFSNKSLRSKRGFTMIELILVIAIGVGLGALIVPRAMDTKNMNDAREESNKVNEFKTAIESMYQRTIDYTGIDDPATFTQVAPSSYERAAGNTALLSIWKKQVLVTSATTSGQYKIEYKAVPAGRVCQEFIRGTQTQGWQVITVNGSDLGAVGGDTAADEAPARIVAVCNAGSTSSSAAVDIEFLHQA